MVRRSEEHTCASGQCVDNTVVCDGRKDCGDGSDETFTQCYNVKCVQQVARRCAQVDSEGEIIMLAYFSNLVQVPVVLFPLRLRRLHRPGGPL